MRAQRVWKPVGPVKSNAEIERLRLELAAFNERIEELEKQHPEASRIEVLRAGALMPAPSARYSATGSRFDSLLPGGRLPFLVALCFLEGFYVPFGWRLDLRVADGSAVAPHKNGVHDRESAPHPKSEAKKKTDDRRPVESHDRWSLSRQACRVQYKQVPKNRRVGCDQGSGLWRAG